MDANLVHEISKMDRGDLIEIEWVDSFTTPGWNSEADIMEVTGGGACCRTSGYLFTHTKDTVTVVQSLQTPPDDPSNFLRFGEAMTIMLGTVLKIRRFHMPMSTVEPTERNREAVQAREGE